MSSYSEVLIITENTERNTSGAEDLTPVYEAVRWIQLLMALLSVLGSGSIIGCLTLQRLSRTAELQPLLLLSVSDLLLAVCWLLGGILYSLHCTSYCSNLHTVEQVLYMASFLYTLNYIWNLYRGLQERLYSCLSGYSVQFSSRVSTAGKFTALFSCVAPVLLMTPVFILGNISQCEANFSQPYRCLLLHTGALYLTPDPRPRPPACSVLHSYHTIVFLSTFIITLLGIIVLMVKARRIYRRVVTSHGYLGHQQRASLRLMDRRILLYPLIFILCWGPAVSLAFLRLVKPSSSQGLVGVVLYISQALTSASQGFLNSLLYGWTRVSLRRSSRCWPRFRDADTQTPLLRGQKKEKRYRTLGNMC